MIKQSLSEVQEFLELKRIAIVGVSQNPEHLSRSLMKSLTDEGIEVLPVNPNAEMIDDMKCYASVGDIEPLPDAAIVTLKKERFRGVVDQCINAGITNVWLYGVTGPKSIDEDLQNYCLEHNLNLVAGYCPFMFLENAEGIHKFHGFLWKLIGLYPKK